MSASAKVQTAAPPGYMLAIVLLAVLGATQTMDPGIANIGLVDATRDIPIPAGGVALAATIATLFASATVVSSGYLADRIGRRRLLVIALVVSIAGELTAALAIQSTMYMVGRALAGAGLGAVFSAAFAYVKVVSGDQRFGSALGLWTSLLTLFAIIGQILGGILIHTVSWRVALLIVPVLCLIALMATPRLLPVVDPVDSDKPDVVGQILLFLGIAGTLYGIANMSNGFEKPVTLVSLLVGVACLVAFALVELRRPNAIFPIRIFTRRIFIAAVLTGLLWNFIQATAVLQLSNLWQYVTGWGSENVTFGQLPMMGATVVGAFLVGRWLAKRVRVGRIFLAGGLLTIVATATLLLVRADSGIAIFLPALLMLGFGLACISVPSAGLFVSEAPPRYFGVVTSSRLMVGQFGYSLATAVTVLMVNGLTQGGVTRKLLDAGVSEADIGPAWVGVNNYVRFGDPEPSTVAGQQALHVAAASYVSAFTTTLLVIGVGALLITILAAYLTRGVRGVVDPNPPTDEEMSPR